jgi:hypothetical protein
MEEVSLEFGERERDGERRGWKGRDSVCRAIDTRIQYERIGIIQGSVCMRSESFP